MNLPLAAAARMSYKAASDIVGKAAVFVVLVVAARTLSPTAFGLFSLASTFGWLLAVATDLGLQIHLAREITATPHRAQAIVTPLFRWRLWLALSGAALSLAAFAWLPARDAFAFALVATAYVVSALVEFLNYLYRALSRSELESTFNVLQRLATVAAVLVMLRVSPTLPALGIALIVPPVVTFLLSVRHMRRLPAIASSLADIAPPFSASTFVRDVLPIGAGIVLSALYFRIDLFLVQYWRGVEDVARYNAVFRLVDALRLFPAAALTVLLPAVFSRRDAEFGRALAAGLLTFGAVVAAALYVAAPLVIALTYGNKYAAAVPTFKVLMLAFPVLCVNYGLTHQLIGWGRQRMYAAISAAALVANVSMNVILIPRLGIAGAAWATLLTEVGLSAAWIWALRRDARATS